MIMKSKKMTIVFLLVFVAISLQSQQADKPVRQVNAKPDSISVKDKPIRSLVPEVDSAEILKKKLTKGIEETDATSERIVKKVDQIAPKLNHAMYKLIVNAPAKIMEKNIVVPITTKELPVNVSEPQIDTLNKPKLKKRFFRFNRD
jgi:hypothetical protein